ncbi:MAG TPA: hypothetical protein VFC28_08550 [Opitutaceae bacterium]|nr:hypothetical protein [Opitutaceae bacterium]
MDEPPAKETPGEGLNKIDLSQLQDFRFGTQWTEIKSVPGARREPEHDRGPRRDGGGRGEGRPRGAEAGEPRRDRRVFHRPGGEGAGATPSGEPESRPAGEPGGAGRPPGEQRLAEGQRRGRPPEREGGGERRWSGPRAPQDYRPYLSPYFNIAFYPDDAGFSALVKAMRASCRTFELFEIARLILGKNDRIVVVATRRPPEVAGPADAPAAAAPPAPAPAKTVVPIYLSLADGLPFDSEEAALAHAMGRHLDRFFDQAVVEVEPPKGNFPFVNRCTLSGELLGPPNYHRYQQIVQQHHAAHFSRMPFEQYRERIETVRDPEVVNQWLEKMKKATRYTWKLGAAGEPPVTFDSVEEARAHLLATARDRVVKAVDSARFSGKLIEALPPGEIRRAIEGHLERQRRFPLDTANALRGRLRREGFTIFKKGSKGISYVCAVKRKFRVQGQSFAESIGGLIGFIESNPMITMRELPLKLLGFALPSGSPPPPPLAPAESAATVAPAAEPAPAGPAEPALTAEQQEKLKRVTMDLHWLVHEGYVTEFADGRLFTPSPMAEARVKATESAEGEEHDPENFPEVPAPAPVAAPEPVAPPPPASTKSVSPAPAPENAPPSAEPPAVPEPVAPLPPASTESVAPVPAPENAFPSAEPIAAPVPPSTEAPARAAADTPPATEPPASAGAA